MYANYIQDMIRQYSATISTNGRSQVIVAKVFDHLDVLAYPKTAENGVMHFIQL